ncbi:unnamed protein product [Scytosiphon promiscuus]
MSDCCHVMAQVHHITPPEISPPVLSLAPFCSRLFLVIYRHRRHQARSPVKLSAFLQSATNINMSLTAAQKSYLANMPVREQDALKSLGDTKTKEIVRDLMADDAVQAKTASPPKRKMETELVVISSWEISGLHDGCLVCGNCELTESRYSLRCGGKCNSFVKQTHDSPDDPLSCQNCRQDMEPKVAYWGRTDTNGKKLYSHVRVADCHGETVGGGSCSVCKRVADSLLDLNRVGETGGDNSICGKCFSKARASELRKCQAGSIEKRNANPYNTPEKKRKPN